MLRTFGWDVGQELDRLQQEVNRLFGRYSGEGADQEVIRPALLTEEREEGWRLAFDVPGVPEDGLEVEVQENAVRIRGERSEPGLRARYERTLILPQSANTEAIQAEHRDGVLELFVPKREQARPRRVEIQSGAQQRQIESETETREPAGAAS